MAPTFVQWKMRPQNSRMSDQNHDIERNIDSASRNQVIGNSIDNKIGNAVDNAVIAVGNRMQDAILRAMDKLVVTRIEMAVRSITGSSGHGTNIPKFGLSENGSVRHTTPLAFMREIISLLDLPSSKHPLKLRNISPIILASLSTWKLKSSYLRFLKTSRIFLILSLVLCRGRAPIVDVISFKINWFRPSVSYPK